MAENSEITAKKPRGKPFPKGESGNKNGRPNGQRNYATIYRDALINIGKANGKTPEEIETMMEEVGMKNALKGNFPFWKDVRDRVHGKPAERTDITTGGKPLQIRFSPIFNKQKDE